MRRRTLDGSFTPSYTPPVNKLPPPMPSRTTQMRMLKSNFECALFLAIRRQEAEGCGETILTQGFRDILEASQKGEKITIATSTKTILYKQH